MAAPSRKCREASEAGADGVVAYKPCSQNAFRNMTRERPPRPLPQRWLRDIFFRSRPPLLSRRGILLTETSVQFIHTFFSPWNEFGLNVQSRRDETIYVVPPELDSSRNMNHGLKPVATVVVPLRGIIKPMFCPTTAPLGLLGQALTDCRAGTRQKYSDGL